MSLLTSALVTAGFVTHPASALAAALNVQAPSHVVVLESQGRQTQHVTTAQTVGAFLSERGIAPGPNDYVHPAAETPLVDNMIVEYSPAVPVKLVHGSVTKTIVTTAGDVGALLEEQGIRLGKHDVVHPSLSDPLQANSTVRVSHVVRWISKQKLHVKPGTIRKIDFALAPHEHKILKAGRAGLVLATIDFTQIDGKIRKHVRSRRTIRKAQPRVIAEGVGTDDAIAQFARRGLEKTAYIASGAMSMVATAYTAGCAGCTGYTARGYRAGHGIVAVDPRVIPLGTKLYIPGYGFAIAGDTGGAIVGHRIDLGFNSLADAREFGRRVVKVYTLH